MANTSRLFATGCWMQFEEASPVHHSTRRRGGVLVARRAFAGAVRSTVLAAMARRFKILRVNDKMLRAYGYVLTAPIGRNFD